MAGIPCLYIFIRISIAVCFTMVVLTKTPYAIDVGTSKPSLNVQSKTGQVNIEFWLSTLNGLVD